jgi:hypothetical protein
MLLSCVGCAPPHRPAPLIMTESPGRDLTGYGAGEVDPAFAYAAHLAAIDKQATEDSLAP